MAAACQGQFFPLQPLALTPREPVTERAAAGDARAREPGAELQLVTREREPSPGPLALQRGGAPSRCRCGVCAANFGRRLDLLEARVLSHWHEFLVHKSEGQRKFEDLFASSRGGGPKPKGAAAAHLAELERRMEGCERSAHQADEGGTLVARQMQELSVRSEEMRQFLERLHAKVGQDFGEAGRSTTELQCSLVSLETRTSELQVWLEARTVDIRREALEVARQGEKQASCDTEELKVALDRRVRRCHDEATTAAERCRVQATGTAEAATERSLRALRSELTASIGAAEATSERQARRSGEQAEAAEAALEQRVGKVIAATSAVEADSVDGLRSLEAMLDQRLRLSKSEAADALRNAAVNLDEQLRRARAESNGTLEALEARLDSRLRRSLEEASEMSKVVKAAEGNFESRLHQGQSEVVARVKREIAEKVGSMQSQMAADISACKEEMQAALTAGGSRADVLARRVGEAQASVSAAVRGAARLREELAEDLELLSRERHETAALTATTEALKEGLTSLRRDVQELLEAQELLQATVHGRALAETERLGSPRPNFRQAEELARLQAAMRSLSQRLGTVEAAADSAGSSASSARAEAAALRSSLGAALEGLQAMRENEDTGRHFSGKVAEWPFRGPRELSTSESRQKGVSQDELLREQRALKSELHEQLQRLAALERSNKEAARAEHGPRLVALASEVERLGQQGLGGWPRGGEARSMELVVKTEANSSRLDELAAQVGRLLRDSAESERRVEKALRAAGQVK
ncbi:unnamed protein product, partial [Polarella glacialis]